MDPFKKKDPQVEADELQDIIRDTLNKKKKPVKFTWKGLGNLGIQLQTNPAFTPLKLKEYKNYKEDQKQKKKIT